MSDELRPVARQRTAPRNATPATVVKFGGLLGLGGVVIAVTIAIFVAVVPVAGVTRWGPALGRWGATCAVGRAVAPRRLPAARA